MKTIYLIIITALLTSNTWGQDAINQTAEGNWLANGTVRFFYTSNSTKLDGSSERVSTTFQIQAAPRVGYFIKENLAIGLEVFVATTSTSLENFDENQNTSTLFAAPFVRYYFYEGFFGEGVVGLGSSTTSDIIFGDQKNNVFGWRLGAGYNLQIGEHLSFEPTLNYSWENQSPQSTGDDVFSPSDSIISSLFVGVGITAYL